MITEFSLPHADKELVNLKLKEASVRIKSYEKRYLMDFDAFKIAWNEGQIPNPYSYKVEKDYREWEAAVTDFERLNQIDKECKTNFWSR